MSWLTARRCVLVAGVTTLLVSTALGARHVAAPRTARARAATRPVMALNPLATPRRANPLLPAPINAAGLYPDLSPQIKAPTFAPAGVAPLYTQADWDAYRAAFGADLDGQNHTHVSGPGELAGKMIAAAETETHPGLRRLLLVRAVALTFRNHDGWAIAGRALEAYQKSMDVSQPAQVAALWTMTDTLSRFSTVPKPERIKCSALAAKANVQLALQLLDYGQLDAAQALIKKTTYHEGWIKNDARLRSQISAARSTINSTATLMDYMQDQYSAVVDKKDEAAAFRLYLFARFVRPSPGIVDDLQTRRSATDIQQLAGTLNAADRDAASGYAAAELLRQTGAGLPAGILRQRTLYAAMHYYRVFLRDPDTEDQRVQRTLAQMQIQTLAADGARGAPVIHPFDPPATATQPASAPASHPATRAAGVATLTPLRRTIAPAAPIAPTASPAPTSPLAPTTPIRSVPVAPVQVDGTPDHPLG